MQAAVGDAARRAGLRCLKEIPHHGQPRPVPGQGEHGCHGRDRAAESGGPKTYNPGTAIATDIKRDALVGDRYYG